MSDWFFCSAWFEHDNQEVHFEIANEDGEQYFFALPITAIETAIKQNNMDALDKCLYAEEDMLAMAVALIEDDYCNEGQTYRVTPAVFSRYFVH